MAVDPTIVFSSSQLNVVALAYFLALGLAFGRHALPFVLLDDPVQAMDDVNALGFADLCRHLQSRRQVVISTHDKRLGMLLERKLAPRVDEEAIRVVEFGAWSEDGPLLNQRQVTGASSSARSILVSVA